MIILPGYAVKVNNVVYAAETSEPAVSSLITLKRFREHVFDDVFDYIQKEARSWKEQAELGCQPSTPLETALSKLSEQDLKNFIKGTADFKKSIDHHIYVSAHENPRAHLEVNYGLVPEEKIAVCSGELEYFESLMSDSDLFEKGLGYQWSVQLTRNNGFLPVEKRILEAIADGTWGSNLITVDPEGYPVREVYGVIKALYGALNPANIDNIEDVSEEVLDILATSSVENFRKGKQKSIELHEPPEEPIILFPDMMNPN